jgi:diguanylate cyclase (GGDEF)-like protein
MRRRFSYALTAGVLSSGAPAGLLGIRLANSRNDRMSLGAVRNELASDRVAYMYVGGATAVIFALFGYILGRQADKLAALSETDALTELLNARGFSSRLRTEIKRSQRYREPFSLLFLDLDDLKGINDRHGHRAGSEALQQVAGVIRAELRETDTAARWGGDEFAILAPNTGKDPALSLAERIRGRIAEQGMPWPLTASIGVATLDDRDEAMPADSRALLRAVDAALYEAKRSGRNTVVAAPLIGIRSPSSSSTEPSATQKAPNRSWASRLRGRRP